MYKKKNIKKVLIIGSGSIASKHVAILSNLNFVCSVFTKRKNVDKLFMDIKNIKFIKNINQNINEEYMFCIIANETYKHFEYLKKLIKLNYNIYCEKPVALKKDHLKILKDYPLKKRYKLICGYQLLKSKLILDLKKLINKKNVKSANIYVGHNIRYWRKNNRSKSYYLNKNLGGGAIYELIHEINLINFLFGKIASIKTFKKASKKYNCEDVAISIFKTKKNIIGSLNQEIVNENFRRHLTILTDKEEIVADIVRGTISIYKKNKLVYSKYYGKINQMKMITNNLKSFIKLLNDKKKISSKQMLMNSIYDAEIALKMHDDKENKK